MSGDDKNPTMTDTIMRPGWVNPGRRPAPAEGEGAPAPAERPADAPTPRDSPQGASLANLDFDLLQGSREGIGPMLGFILFASRLRSVPNVADPEALRTRVELALKKAILDACRIGWDPRYVDLARYFVCCTIDEAAQNTPWGQRWAAKPLVSSMSQNATGGEKFFSQVDAMLRQPQIFDVRLFEVAHACLIVGFRGQFAMAAGGEETVAAYRERLAMAIQEKGGTPSGELYAMAIPSDRPPPVAIRALPLWVPVVACLAVVALGYVAMLSLLQARASTVFDRLDVLAETPVSAPPRMVQASVKRLDASILREIRALAERRGWPLQEMPGVLGIVISGPSVFASASEVLEPGLKDDVARLGGLLARLEPQIKLRGHSDLNTYRGFRFPGGDRELSRARAESIRSALGPQLRGEPLVEGLAQGEPLCPDKGNECSARNRRVEVIASFEGQFDGA